LGIQDHFEGLSGPRGAAVGIEPGCPQGETCIAPRAAQATLGARVKPLGQTGCAADYRRKPGHRPKTKTRVAPLEIGGEISSTRVVLPAL